MAPEDVKSNRWTNWLDLTKAVALPLVTLCLGGLFNASLNSRQERENNIRLYTDMMGRREDSDSAVRKDMFQSILSTFLKHDTNMNLDKQLDEHILNLELLAYNFHESLDLGPLFKHVRHEIPLGTSENYAGMRKRLEKVASEVSEQQLTVVSDGGAVVRGNMGLEGVDDHPQPLDYNAVPCAGDVPATWPCIVPPPPPPKTTGSAAPAVRGSSRLCMSIPAKPGWHYRQFKLQVFAYDDKAGEVGMWLQVSKPLSEQDCKKPDLVLDKYQEAGPQFYAGLFAFPMIDNTRLSTNERCAVTVAMLTKDQVQVAIAYFPGSRASLKDKPYYEEVLRDLLNNPASSARKGP